MSVVLGYVSLLLCGFVALSVRMCIAWANEVEGTKSSYFSVAAGSRHVHL